MTTQELQAEIKRLQGMLKANRVATGCELVTDSERYPNVYLSLGSKWIQVNKGCTLNEQGRATVEALRKALVEFDLSTAVVRDCKK